MVECSEADSLLWVELVTLNMGAFLNLEIITFGNVHFQIFRACLRHQSQPYRTEKIGRAKGRYKGAVFDAREITRAAILF